MNTIPEEQLIDQQINRLFQHQKLQHMIQSYRKMWKMEYLYQLQHRPKWQGRNDHILQVGTILILKENNLPPTYGKMGRISQLWPRSDGLL